MRKFWIIATRKSSTINITLLPVTLHISFSLFDFFLLNQSFLTFLIICLDLFNVDADNYFIKICQFIRKENKWVFFKIISEQPLSNTNLTFNKGIWRPVCKENVYWYLVGLVLKYELMCIYIREVSSTNTYIHTTLPLSLSLSHVFMWMSS